MSTERERWVRSATPLMPWESMPGGSGWPRDSETVSSPAKPVLYDHLGRPLVRERRFGFRPEDAK